jgi:hypothetical protein
MATVTEIAGLIQTALLALDDVDQADINSYLPPIKTQSVALVIPPLDQKTRAYTPTAGRGTWIFWHQIRCEFWVKLNAGDISSAVQKAREIGLQAINVLLTDATLNNNSLRIGWYGQSTGQVIEADVTDRPIEVGGVPYFVATVYVSITDYGV